MANSISEAIRKDLEQITSDSAMQGVYQDVAFIYDESIERNNERATNPDGTQRASLSERHANAKQQVGLPAKPDLHFTGKAERSLDYGIVDGGVRFSYSSAEANDYMYEHEYGQGGMPQRRQFAVEGMSETDSAGNASPTNTNDTKSSMERANIAEIEKALEEHLNQDRTIRVSS